jgi:hypothetical protein
VLVLGRFDEAVTAGSTLFRLLLIVRGGLLSVTDLAMCAPAAEKIVGEAGRVGVELEDGFELLASEGILTGSSSGLSKINHAMLTQLGPTSRAPARVDLMICRWKISALGHQHGREIVSRLTLVNGPCRNESVDVADLLLAILYAGRHQRSSAGRNVLDGCEPWPASRYWGSSPCQRAPIGWLRSS